jgi:hypothetical protein
VFDDSKEFEELKARTRGFHNVEKNDKDVLYDRETLVDYLSSFDGVVLVTSLFCPILRHGNFNNICIL